MARTARKASGNSAEERRQEAEQLHATLRQEIAQLRDSDRWAAALAAVVRFHHYSLNNILLIMSQMPTATQVAGYRMWQAAGRQVRKGEKGLRIYGYSTKRVRDTDEATDTNANGTDDAGTDDGSRIVVRFPVLSVFDVSQTDPIPGAQQPEDLAQPLNAADPYDIAAKVADNLTAQGWTVEDGPLPAGIYGTTSHKDRRIRLSPDQSAADRAATLLHETAHALLHADSADYRAHRGIAETEAESVAYVVAGLFGLDTSRYSVGYVAGWSGCDDDVIAATATRVLDTSRVLFAALTGDQAEEETAADPVPVA